MPEICIDSRQDDVYNVGNNPGVMDSVVVDIYTENYIYILSREVQCEGTSAKLCMI